TLTSVTRKSNHISKIVLLSVCRLSVAVIPARLMLPPCTASATSARRVRHEAIGRSLPAFAHLFMRTPATLFLVAILIAFGLCQNELKAQEAVGHANLPGFSVEPL